MSVRYSYRLIKRIFWSILVVILLTLINNAYIHSRMLSILIYSIQTILIGVLTYKERKTLKAIFSRPFILLAAILIVLNVLLSSYKPEYGLLIKYWGYIVAVSVGMSVANYGNLKLPKVLLVGLVIVPLCLVAFLDHSIYKNAFFPNSNNFVFWGAVVSFLYYISSTSVNKFRNSIIILLSYILVGSTIGIVLALVITIVLKNIKNIRSIIILFVVSVMTILLLSYSEIGIFTRMRAVLQTFAHVDVTKLSDIADLNLYELNQYADAGERTDNTSALWRIQQWLGLIKSFLEKWYFTLFVGLGENFTTFKTGLPPHNDMLKILCEYGLIVFVIYIKYILKAIRVLFNSKYIYFVLTIIIFHISENLIHTFPTNFIFYFSLGYACTKRQAIQMIKN